jgi:uncharacterized damage-inducible protein DinB
MVVSPTDTTRWRGPAQEVLTMAGMVSPVADERSALLDYLAQQRYVLRLTAYGLTDEQARATPTAGPLSVGSLISHVAAVEERWIDTVLQRPPSSDADADDRGFQLGPDDTLAAVLERYETVARRTDDVIAGVADLGEPVPVPQGVPWFPDDVDAWSVRWVLLHLIEETARHAGHADIVRESVDGATAFPIMAAAEGWPSTPWLQPWQPAAS